VINGSPIGQSDGTFNTFQFNGNMLAVTPVDSTGAVIPGSYSTYSLTASKDMQYSLNIATDTPNPYNDVSIFQRISN
jgi:predicted lysophospholipase L1 biosynthesis ABC-type transport system permease subunit